MLSGSAIGIEIGPEAQGLVCPPGLEHADSKKELIAGATLMEGLLAAFAVDRTNVFVLKAIMNGMRHCILMKKNTPSDIIRHRT